MNFNDVEDDPELDDEFVNHVTSEIKKHLIIMRQATEVAEEQMLSMLLGTTMNNIRKDASATLENYAEFKISAREWVMMYAKFIEIKTLVKRLLNLVGDYLPVEEREAFQRELEELFQINTNLIVHLIV